MRNNKDIKPPAAAIIYGEIARWTVIAGCIIAIVGSIVYFTSNGYINRGTLMSNLWSGANCQTLWQSCSSNNTGFQSNWYLSWLPCGDAIAMLGIAVACFAGVIGMWGALFGTIRGKTKVYVIFALTTAVVLTLSALGILKVNM